MDNQKVENVNTMISINPAEPIPEPITKLKKRKSSKIFFKVALFMMRGRSKKSKVLPPDDESRSIWRKLVGSMRPMHLQSHRSPPQINNEQNQKMVITENSSNNDNIQSEDGFDSASEFPNSPSPNLPSPTSSRYASTVGLSEMVNSPSTGSSRYASAVGLSEMANSPSHVSSRYASAVGLSEMAEEEEKENEEEQEDEEEKENEEEQEDEEEKENEEEEEQEDEEEEVEEEEKENENEGNVVGDEMIDAKADEFIAQFYQQMKLQRMNIVDRHYKEISMRSLGI